jgi:hypothetical protein
LQVNGITATALSEAEFLDCVGGSEGSLCALQLDRDDGGGQSHVVDVSVIRAGEMDEDQRHIPSSYTGQQHILSRLIFFISARRFVTVPLLSSSSLCRSSLCHPVTRTHYFLGKEPEDASGRQSPSIASERSVGSFDMLKDSHGKVTLVQRCWYMLGLQLTKDTHKNVLVKSIRPDSPAALCRFPQFSAVAHYTNSPATLHILVRCLILLFSSRAIRVGDCVRYVNGKAVNGRSVDDVLKDLVGDEGQSLEISFRAADETKSQVRCSCLVHVDVHSSLSHQCCSSIPPHST